MQKISERRSLTEKKLEIPEFGTSRQTARHSLSFFPSPNTKKVRNTVFERLRQALKREKGKGILAQIDVQEKEQEKQQENSKEKIRPLLDL